MRAEITRAGQLPAVAAVMSAAFLLAAVTGLASLVVSELPQLSFAQSLAYAGLGVWGWNISRTVPGAQRFLRGVGVAFLVLWFVGVFGGRQQPLSLLGLDPVDNLVHLGVAIVALLLATIVSPRLTAD
ncbi:hypothetical protein DI005_09980 [Prauserella sp. PE36]|nr:hypothetical protein BAY59_16640 [Prauserella coralliicola]RBM21587.1 hypothetical protein DI005_09980 [Prauserella sp. PE36]